MQIFFCTMGTLEQYETRWEENKNWQTCPNFEMSFVNSKIQMFFPTFFELEKKWGKKTQLNDNLLSSFPLRSGITKPVFPTGDTLRSVGNGRPLVLSSDSWYICLCTGCRCQFSPKRCMAEKVEIHPWELAKRTRNAKFTKRQFRHKKDGSCEMEKQERVSKRGRTIQSRMVNWMVFQKCWSVRCEHGLRENLYLKTPTIEAAVPSGLCSPPVQRSQQAQWTRGVSMKKQWMKDADILQGQQKKRPLKQCWQNGEGWSWQITNTRTDKWASEAKATTEADSQQKKPSKSIQLLYWFFLLW